MKTKTNFMKKIISLCLVLTLMVSAFATLSFSASAVTGDIYVRGTFTNNWANIDEYKMTSKGNDNYAIIANVPAGSHEYKFANADWSYNTPSQNVALTLASDSSVLFEVNTNTGMYGATVLSGDTNRLSLSKQSSNVVIKCAWAEHSDQVLTLSGSNLSYISESQATNKKWNIIPTDTSGVFYIQNAETRGYLTFSGGSVICHQLGISNDYGKWIIDKSSGNYRLINYKDASGSINVESQSGSAQYSYVPSFYTSSQWNIEFSDYQYQLQKNGIDDTRGTVKVNSPNSMTSTVTGSEKTWTKSVDTSDSPIFTATNTPLLEAVYNLSMEEVYQNKFESTYGTAFYTGVNWKKVWTRDTAMSCQYSLADIFPDIAMNCAKEKVVGTGSQRTFEQDTGTGGSYPVSDDKIITMLSVWEIYLATGNKDTLSYFYDIAYNTVMQDFDICFEKSSGLFKGETCGLDWRDQTYPDWTSETYEEGIANIAESKATSVNVIYCEVFDIMAKSAEILSKGSEAVSMWNKLHDDLKEAVSTRLWHDDLGLYSAWEYPEYMGSPLAYKADVIANGYALMYGVGTDEQLRSIAENYPLVTYGANVVYPQKQGTLANANKIYHNFGVWPGWEATLMLGAAENDYNELSEEIWNSCVRGAATSLTNKEVINYTTGEGVESDRQLWSIAGTLAGYYKVLFGMEYSTDGLEFTPYVPSWAEGPFSLTNYKYQNATLNITLKGSGDTVSSFILDGRAVANDYILPFGYSGTHTIEITLTDSGKTEKINLSDEKNHVVCPSLPDMTYSNGVLRWTRNSSYTYKLYDGTQYIDVSDVSTYTPDKTKYACYSLVAISADGVWSEMSKPIVVNPDNSVIKVEAEDGIYKTGTFRTKPSGYSGTGIVDDPVATSSPVSFNVTIPKDSTYYMTCVYNNKGAPNTSSNCVIRSVYVDGKDCGALVMPVMNFYYQTSTHLPLELSAGTHTVKVMYDTADFFDRNMAITTNNVQYDYFTFEEASSVATKKVLLGDADDDGEVTIMDATAIQRDLARLTNNSFVEKAADADQDGNITIIDATTIQLYLAKLLKDTKINTYI